VWLLLSVFSGPEAVSHESVLASCCIDHSNASCCGFCKDQKASHPFFASCMETAARQLLPAQEQVGVRSSLWMRLASTPFLLNTFQADASDPSSRQHTLANKSGSRLQCGRVVTVELSAGHVSLSELLEVDELLLETTTGAKGCSCLARLFARLSLKRHACKGCSSDVSDSTSMIGGAHGERAMIYNGCTYLMHIVTQGVHLRTQRLLTTCMLSSSRMLAMSCMEVGKQPHACSHNFSTLSQ
jgi:hypothetical protein